MKREADPDGPAARFGPALPPDFFAREPDVVARDLLGCYLISTAGGELVAVRLTEVEAYGGSDDPGSHAYRGQTPRNASMFAGPGTVYVYRSYGVHWCVNLVTGPAGQASAVLLRAGEVVAGAGVARGRRQSGTPAARSIAERDLARGPGRLTAALGIDRSLDGSDLFSPGALSVRGQAPSGLAFTRTRRTGVSGPGAARLWRFAIAGDPWVSPVRSPKER